LPPHVQPPCLSHLARCAADDANIRGAANLRFYPHPMFFLSRIAKQRHNHHDISHVAASNHHHHITYKQHLDDEPMTTLVAIDHEFLQDVQPTIFVIHHLLLTPTTIRAFVDEAVRHVVVAVSLIIDAPAIAEHIPLITTTYFAEALVRWIYLVFLFAANPHRSGFHRSHLIVRPSPLPWVAAAISGKGYRVYLWWHFEQFKMIYVFPFWVLYLRSLSLVFMVA